MSSKNIVVLVCIMLSVSILHPLAVAQEIPYLGRGINFGNKLESPRGQPWGPPLEEWNFARAKEGGFDSVRLPIRWYEYAANTPPYKIEPEFLDHVEWAVNQAISREMAIVINMHHYDPLYADPVDEKAKFLTMWRQIAERFKTYPNDLLVFEILNEPHGLLTVKRWNEFLMEAYTIIRETNPDRYIMIGTAEWGGVNAMNRLQLPDDDKLILTVHYYEPFQFTHQGAEWVNDSEAWCGTRWTGSKLEQYYILNRLNLVANWAKEHDNIHVFLGEFGAYPKCTTPEDLVLWVNFIARESEKRGFSWGYWEFNSGFGCHAATESGGWNYIYSALIPEADPIALPTTP